jgi:hypothetical protein
MVTRTYCKYVPLCYSQAMKTRTHGYVITEVPGLKNIVVRPDNNYAEILLDIELPGVADTTVSYDREGLGDLIEGLQEARRLAAVIDTELTEPS